MNCTAQGRQLINEMNKSKRNSKIGFTSIFEKKESKIIAWDKFLGEHTILGHKQIGEKNNLTGEITMF